MRGIKELFAPLKGARHLEVWALLALFAVALLLYLGTQSGGESVGTALEARMERVLGQIEGAGKVRVLIQQSADVPAFAQTEAAQKVDGVVVVAEGADDLRVRLEISRAIKALLGVPLERIEVLSMEKGRGA